MGKGRNREKEPEGESDGKMHRGDNHVLRAAGRAEASGPVREHEGVSAPPPEVLLETGPRGLCKANTTSVLSLSPRPQAGILKGVYH